MKIRYETVIPLNLESPVTAPIIRLDKGDRVASAKSKASVEPVHTHKVSQKSVLFEYIKMIGAMPLNPASPSDAHIIRVGEKVYRCIPVLV